MLFSKIAAVCIEDHKNIVKALCQQNSIFLNIMVLYNYIIIIIMRPILLYYVL